MARAAKKTRKIRAPRSRGSTTRHRARPSSRRRSNPRRWSQRVTEQSDALTLEQGVFKKGSARQIALSLKRSAERSRRRKSDPYRSAMSMLTFYINRAGRNLPASRKKRLGQAKEQLRGLYGRD